MALFQNLLSFVIESILDPVSYLKVRLVYDLNFQYKRKLSDSLFI